MAEFNCCYISHKQNGRKIRPASRLPYMTIRRFLIIAPVIVSLVLLVSYFWVPSYEDQTKGNPDRLVQFITASGGDAAYLNPIFASDTTSGDINGMVFEGLIDRDENLQFRGRLAHSWKIYEQAYFYVYEKAGKSDQLVSKLKAVMDPGKPEWQHIQSIDLLPSKKVSRIFKIKQDKKEKSITLEAQSPPQVRIVLNRVDQELFDRIEKIIGDGYFDRFDPTAYLTARPDLPARQLNKFADILLPAKTHNPIIEFYLRPGVKFHDGHEVTAEDVKFTYESIMNPKNISPRVPDFEPVQKVEILDPLTVRITYKRLYSPAFGTWGMGIIPAHLLNAQALDREIARHGKDPKTFTMRQSLFNRNPIGSGPFVFDNWKSDQYILLKRYDDYWEGTPNYEKYTMRIIPDPLTREMEFYAGTIDNYGVLPHQVDRLKKDERFQNFSGPSFGYTYIGYNLRREPFKDPRVRRALGMAIDTEKIIKYVLYGQGEKITGPFVKETDFYNHGIAPLPYDPEGAVKLLAEAGWKKGADGYLYKNGKRLSFTLITNNGNPLRKDILAIAQDAWKKIGIEVRTDLLEWSVFIEKRVNQLDFDALILGWSMGIDPDLYQIWHSSQTNKYQLNFVGFSNSEADDLIIKIRQEYDHERQVKYSHRLHEIITNEQPYTFLYVSRWTAILDKRITRLVTEPDGSKTYKPIVPTKTGNYTFHFNQWIKLSQPHAFLKDG